MKLCPKCVTEKPYEDFYKCKSNRDGFQSYCKTCIKAANTTWAKEHKEAFKEYSRNFANTPHRKAYLEHYKELNSEKLKAKIAEYKAANVDKIKESNRLYRENNKDKIRDSNKRYVEKNLATVLSKAKAYREANKPKYAKHTALRRAEERRAKPLCLSSDDIKRMELIWGLRDLKSFVTGQEFEVDHIVPLRGKTVCGLHVPWNLRVIPKKENRSKQAHTWPDMWD